MQDNDSMKDNVAFHCVQMQCMASVCTTSKSRLWMKSSTCSSDLRGEPCWGVKANRQVAWPGKPSAVFQYWAASPIAPAEHASCIVGPHSTVSKDKASLHSEKWCWLRMAWAGCERRPAIRFRLECHLQCRWKLSWFIRHMSDGLIFYSNLWNLSSDIWDQLSEMSEDFREHCIRCRRCQMDDRWLPCWQGNSDELSMLCDNVTADSRAILTSS